jgi:hypothetical protein
MIATAGIASAAILTTPAADAKPVKLGKTITLKGNSGEKMRVRPYRVKAFEAGEFETPAEGNQYVGVWISLKNVGRKRYSDAPGNGAKLVDTRAKVHDSTIVVSGDTCETTSDLRIPAGQTRRICIPFEVPTGVRLRYFEFTLNSGFADQTGQWKGLPSIGQ